MGFPILEWLIATIKVFGLVGCPEVTRVLIAIIRLRYNCRSLRPLKKTRGLSG